MVIPGYTSAVKTAISVPDRTFERAERAAQRHGLNRSQLYATAVERYLDELEAGDLTAAIDAVVEVANADHATGDAASAGRRVVADGDEEW